MLNKSLFVLLICAFMFMLIGCFQTADKIYKVTYQGNIPIGTFNAKIDEQVIFTNGYDILEVYKGSQDFFCYSVDKEQWCDLNIYIKISDDAAKKMANTIKNLQIVELNYPPNRSVLSKELIYYFKDDKLGTLALDSSLKEQLLSEIVVPITGKGATKVEAKKNAIKRSDEVISVLIDVPDN